MASRKTRTAIVIGVIILLAAGTIMVVPRQKADSAEGARTAGDPPAQEIVGVGLLLRFDAKTKTILIDHVVPDSPAAQAGLASGLIVSKINGASTADLNLRECVNLIRGASGTKLTLELATPDTHESKNVELTREKLRLK